MPELPPEAVLKYYRAMGLGAFFDLLGWDYTIPSRVTVKVDSWTPQALWKFCQKYEVPLDDVEKKYLGDSEGENQSAMTRWWTDGEYSLYVSYDAKY